MRIGIVTGEYPPMEGGVSAYCSMLASQLSELNHTLAVISDPRAVAPDSRIRVSTIPSRWNLSALRKIARWASAEELDVINLHFQTGMYGMSPWIHLLPDWVRRVPIVTTFHDLRVPYLFPKAGALRLMAVKWLARRSDAVIATNPEDQAALGAWGIDAQIIPIGSNVEPVPMSAEERLALHTRMQGETGTKVLAHFGFLNHSKGIEHLLEAAAHLRAEGQRVRIWMIGGRTGASDPTNVVWGEKLDRLIAELNLEGCIEWTGYISEPEAARYMQAADLVCLPFLDGASPRRSSLLAAAAQGACILTTQPTVRIENFHHGENLWLVAAANTNAVYEGLVTLLADEPLQDRLRAGAALLAHAYDWSVIATKTSAALASVIGGS
jgi:glycosyltransferase involved in cell wall biosynthesis